MAGFQAFSEVHIQDDLDQDLAFPITLERIDDGLAGPEMIEKFDMKVFPFHDVEVSPFAILATSYLKITDVQVYYNGVELSNRRLLITFANMDHVRLWWKVKEKLGKHLTLRGIRPVGGVRLSTKHQNWLQMIGAAFQQKINPKLTDEGTGSTYILYNSNRRPIGVFKPVNEEAFTPFNPRGYIGRMGQKGFRSGVVSGEGGAREVAAYLLDAYYGSLSNVPVTLMVEAIHPFFCYDPSNPRSIRDDMIMDGLFRRKKKDKEENNGPVLSWKIGSLQEFVDAKESCGDYDASLFSVSDVHKIGILDIRLCNMDRNDGNILVVKEEQKLLDHRLVDLLDESEFIQSRPRYREQNLLTIDGRRTKYRLIPIDHGLTLPDCFDVTDFDLNWIRWPQARIGFSADELDYIEKLKPDKDAEWLKGKLDIRPECLRAMQVTTRLLKKAAKLGMNLYQIAMLMVRLSPDQPSTLEQYVQLAVSQTWYSCYQSNLVHQRALQMNCIMDLATPRTSVKSALVSTSNSGAKKNVQFPIEQPPEKLLRHTSIEDSIGSTSGSMGGRSKTVGRLKSSPQSNNDELLQKTANKLRNYTNWRGGVRRDADDPALNNNIWTIEDVGGRVLSPDWDDPQVLKRFFDALDNILSLRLPGG